LLTAASELLLLSFSAMK